MSAPRWKKKLRIFMHKTFFLVCVEPADSSFPLFAHIYFCFRFRREKLGRFAMLNCQN